MKPTRASRITTVICVMAMSVLSVAPALAVDQGTAETGPFLGKWQFTGKDNTGLVWTGTLVIEKLDPARFDPKRYPSMCSLEVESNDPSKGTRSVEAPCEWVARSRTLSFTTGYTVLHVDTAVPTTDGKSLTQGKWTETKKDSSGKGGEAIVRSGTWSATLPGK